VAALARGGVTDFVRDGVNGVLYEPEEPDGLAGAVARGARARFDYTRLRATAVPFARERFEREFRGELEDLLGKKAGS
jgi:glycosyltransferase involved in cell wall biosynthesis